jgi:hypothetical protein
VDAFVAVYRFLGIGLIIYWLMQIGLTIPKPADWQPRGAERLPIRISRRRYLAIGVLGVIAEYAVLGFSLVAFR